MPNSPPPPTVGIPDIYADLLSDPQTGEDEALAQFNQMPAADKLNFLFILTTRQNRELFDLSRDLAATMNSLANLAEQLNINPKSLGGRR